MCREARPRISRVDRLLNPEVDDEPILHTQTPQGWFQQTIIMTVNNWADQLTAEEMAEYERAWNVFDGFAEPIDQADWMQIWERCTEALAEMFSTPIEYREWQSAWDDEY